MFRLVTAARVLVGPVGEVIHDGAVLVEDRTIRAVGPRSVVHRRAPADVVRHDHPHGTALPGLVDAHVHLVLDAGDAPVDTLRSTCDDGVYTGMLGRAQQSLRAGVTTVRDLGDRSHLAIRLRDAVARDETTGPRVLTSGPPLTVPKGHCWFLGGEVDGERQIRARIRDTAHRGADVIKVMASGGSITPESPAMWESQFDAAQLRVIVDEATHHGLPVAAHAHGTAAIRNAISAGVSTVEHCTWMGPQHNLQRPDDAAAALAQRGMAACVATSHHWREVVANDPERARQRFGRLPWMDGHGITLIPGTDAGLSGSAFDALPDALGVYEHVGFTPQRILEMATTGSAAALGLGARTGRLTPGHDADLLVVQGDPTADLSALHQPRLVLARGQPVTTAGHSSTQHNEPPSSTPTTG